MNKILFYNGHFATLDSTQPKIDALYVEDGRIRAMGTFQELDIQLGRADVAKVNLQGNFVYPGFVDNHMHLAAHGMKLSMLDFTEVTSKEEMLYHLRKKVESTPKGEWVLGLNWNENQFPDKAIPTIDELDQIAPEQPVYLTRTCYHVQLANSEAFRRAGISPDVTDPADGSYGRDNAGRMNGLIYENAAEPFRQAQPTPTYAQLKEYVRQGMKDALTLGLTGVHTEDLRMLGNVSDTLKIYQELIKEGNLLRSHHLIYYPHLAELQELGVSTGYGDAWVAIGACKIFADGAIGGRTALLSKPYADDPSKQGIAIHSQEELNAITARARQLRMSIAVHAIGDLAAEMVIRAMGAYPIQQYAEGIVRDRLIHAQVLRKELVDRLKQLQVAIDIQPRFVASDFPWVMDRLGEERLDYAYAWRKLLDAGLHCGAGSDAPIEPLNPLLGIHAAITRRSIADPESIVYLPSEKLTAKEAIQLFTIGSATTASEESKRGSFVVGKYADLSVFDRNILTVHPDELLQAKAVCTVVNGQIAYSRLS